MRLSFGLRTRARFGLPKKSLASIASWVIFAPLISLVVVTSSASSASANGTVYSFTNAGATGANGPTQAQATSSYSGTTLASAVTITNQGIQEWVVPSTGTYRVTVVGAHGAASLGSSAYRGGRSAIVQGEMNLTSGTKLFIIVGQAGRASSAHGGGGGASVALGCRHSSSLLLVLVAAGYQARGVERGCGDLDASGACCGSGVGLGDEPCRRWL